MLLTGKIALYCFLSVLVLAVPISTFASDHSSPDPDYQLAISFDVAKKLLTGTARITLEAGDTLTLHTGSLKITGILLKKQDGSSYEMEVPHEPVFRLYDDAMRRELFMSYTITMTGDGENLISANGITLLDNWYPTPDRRMQYQLSATLPEGFVAITESDIFPLDQDGNTVSATFTESTATIHFAAAPYSLSSLEVREGLKIHTLFFPEDAHLARGYLEKSKDYIRRYEDEIGPFPYNHYVIVANRLPIGLGMPTFTLLGQAVLRLPFIKDTSLGHEILHSWFGNSIDVDALHGNWCEGLTAYLADHAYRQDKTEGAAYRKEAIVNYLSYVKQDNVIPLSEFMDASHSQPLAKARRAIGYSKALLLFHELHERLGDRTFNTGIRLFYTQFRGKAASWNDIRDIFNALSEEDLTSFFSERLSRTDMPEFYAKDISISQQQDSSMLKFQLIQETQAPYSLHIPISVTTGQGIHNYIVKTDSAEAEVTLTLPSRPLEFTLDPEYSLLREITLDETPAAWSRFMGAGKKRVVVKSEEAKIVFQPLLDLMQDESWIVKYDHEITNTELGNFDLLILGSQQSSYTTLFGNQTHPDQGFTVDVRHNPLNPDHVAVLVSSSSVQETGAAASRLPHYGKYSYLHFNRGRASERRIPESEFGQSYILERLPVGGSTEPLSEFSIIAQELSRQDVVYIGESHTSVSDHRLQLRLIEAIAGLTPDLAIGMEMFPASSQNALDEYIMGRSEMTEKEFLKASGYFKVWRYDFRYFQEIFNFSRMNNIPTIGLNLDRATVSTVYTSGSTDELSDETRDSLPQERNLDMKGYTERLRDMHSMHEQGSHGNGQASGFIQAQAIWDETMAQNIAHHLLANPGRKMIVLAGAQHTRKDSGIPPRVARRIEVQQASILNILNGSNPSNLQEVADYFFLSDSLELEDSPKMGIVLQEHKATDEEYVEIIEFTPHSKANEAGLLAGDILIAIGGYPIRTMEDIRISMFDAIAGDNIRVEVKRSEEDEQRIMAFDVELVTLPAEKPRP